METRKDRPAWIPAIAALVATAGVAFALTALALDAFAGAVNASVEGGG